VPIALLANTRPGILLRAENKERDSLFQTIELVITDRKERITAHLQEAIAPNASYLLGPKRVRELCGTRPIIGMFIARELERYAIEGRLDESVVARLRGGDLQGWMNRRFQEDGLTPKVTEELLPPTPAPMMIAAAAGPPLPSVRERWCRYLKVLLELVVMPLLSKRHLSSCLHSCDTDGSKSRETGCRHRMMSLRMNFWS
jgi:hypothetical protein